MAQSEATPTGSKRGPGRPAQHAQPAEKKRKTSVVAEQTPLSSSLHSPLDSSPAPDRRRAGLPAKLTDARPLPTLAEAQPLSLPADDYQSIAASAVLHVSLERSRLNWVCQGVLEKYWIKPESGKHARPPPPNNPDVKLQKHKGPCRIRIEPHIFEAELYVEEKAKPPPPVKQYVPPSYQRSAFGQPYRPNQPPYAHSHQQQQYYQNRPMPPLQTHGNGHAQHNHLPPPPSIGQVTTPSQQPSRPQQPATAPPQQDKKASPDPVISMLANRASSDPELKALMKEVATGNASQDQLKIFQGHIDELTNLINDKKKKEEDGEAQAAAAAAAAAPTPGTQANEMIQYDGTTDQKAYQQQQQQQQPYQPPAYQQPQPWVPPPPALPPALPPPPISHPVVIAFTTPGATEDRFLFPQNSITEALSPQHLLVSFIVTRKGHDAVDSANLDAEREYWQPVTLMVEVAYNREHIIECVRKWVKPAEEVRKYMEEVMGRCTKVPDAYLALRLPFKGSAMAETEDMMSASGGRGTPVQVPAEEKQKRKSSVQNAKKASSLVKSENAESSTGGPEKIDDGVVEKSGGQAEAPSKDAPEEAAALSAVEGADTTAAAEDSRPRRNTRKSVRISLG